MKWKEWLWSFFLEDRKFITLIWIQDFAQLLWARTNGGGVQVVKSIQFLWRGKPRNQFWYKYEFLIRFCVFEIGERRERKLNRNEKPLAVQVFSLIVILCTTDDLVDQKWWSPSIQSHWSSSSSSYQRFVLRRATRSVSNQVSDKQTNK